MENFPITIMKPALTFDLLGGPPKLYYCHEINWSLRPVKSGYHWSLLPVVTPG